MNKVQFLSTKICYTTKGHDCWNLICLYRKGVVHNTSFMHAFLIKEANCLHQKKHASHHQEKIWKNTTIEEKKGSQICMLKWHTYQVCLHIFHAKTWKCILFFSLVRKKNYIIWPSKNKRKRWKMVEDETSHISSIKYTSAETRYAFHWSSIWSFSETFRHKAEELKLNVTHLSFVFG